MNYQQLNIMDAIREGEKLRDEGMQTAVDHANAVAPDWSEKAWQVFKEWIMSKPEGYSFMMETFRLHCEAQKKLETPPSKRAFGFLTPKAAKMGLIRQNGTAKVNNSAAHRANAAVWVVN